MAKPTGAIDFTESIMTVGGEPDGGPYLWDYIYAIFNLPRMPSHWNDDGYVKRQKVYIDWYANVIMTSTLRTFFRMHNHSGMDYYEGASTTATTPDWGGGAFPVTSEGYPKGTPIDELQWQGDKPHGLACEMNFQHGNTEADSEVFGIYVETKMDKAYTGAFSEANTRYPEQIERITHADKAYSEKRPCSSWMMMELANTLNTFMYEARISWTLPLFGGP